MIHQFPVVAEFDRLFEGFLTSGRPPAAAPGYRRVNIWEDDDGLTVEAELPGFSLENIDITLEDRELTIAGHREAEAQKSDCTCRCSERVVGRFSRTFRLPFDIEAAKVEATLLNGILNVRLPKHEGARARKIEVRTA
jgi:HSP20 family protein